MNIKILTVGSKSTDAMTSLIADYEKRMPSSVRIEWQFLKHGIASDVATSKQQESENILSKLSTKDFVIVLDETGAQLTSEKLSEKLFQTPRNIVIIIGGAHGVSKAAQDKADFIWSLSKLVFPHQLVRLILAEQLYRAHCIHVGHPYHHA